MNRETEGAVEGYGAEGVGMELRLELGSSWETTTKACLS